MFNFYPFRKIQIPDVVISGTSVLIDYPIGPRFKRLGFEIGDTAQGDGNAPAMSKLENGTLKLGSGIEREFTGAYLDLLNSLNGSQYAARDSVTGGANGTGRKMFQVYLEEPWRKRNDYANGLAWQTGFLGKNDVFQAKLTFSAGVTPAVKAWAIVDDFNEGKAHNIVKWFLGEGITNAATFEKTDLFRGAPANDLVSQLSLFNTSDAKTILSARLKLGAQDVYEDVSYQQNFTDLLGSDMNPAAGAFHFVLDQDDMFESLRKVGDMQTSQMKATLSAASAGTIKWIIQRLGLPE